MHDLTLVIHTAEGPLTYRWCVGGAYIEVTLMGAERASDVINVWDYEHDACQLETIEELVTECEAHADRLLADGGHDLYAALQETLF